MIFDNEKNKNVSLGRKEFVRKKKALRFKIKKALRPDGLPNVVLKEFALELGPVISDMYDASIRQGFLPPLLKSADVRPPPKQKPARSVEN